MSAIISDCGLYRYVLTREPEDLAPTKPAAVFVMLNPSTADAHFDDATIRRCRSFAKSWGCAGIVVVNLYALRATKPAALWEASDAVGGENNSWLQGIAREHRHVVCAWGKNAKRDRVEHVVNIFLEQGATLHCLGTNKDGSPKHPLYLRSDSVLLPWSST